MAKADRLYTAQEGAYMTRLTLSSFRTKVSKLGIKGKRQGAKVFCTRKQLEDVHKGVRAENRKAPKKVEARKPPKDKPLKTK